MQQSRLRRIQVVVEQRRLSVSLSDELRLPERALHGETRGQRARATRPEDGQAAFERDEQRLWTQGHSKQVWSTPRGAHTRTQDRDRDPGVLSYSRVLVGSRRHWVQHAHAHAVQ